MGPEKNMTHFLVFTEAENKLLLAACSNMEKAEFVVADNEDFTPHGEHYVGFVSASFLGTHFTLYDHGVPAEELPDGAMPRVRRKEHCMVVYKSNILGRVPNSMRVVLGGSDGNEAVVEGGLEARLEDPSASSTINILHTKQPRWNAELDAWTMDFKGRVKLASKKNFQLINSDERECALAFRMRDVADFAAALPHAYLRASWCRCRCLRANFCCCFVNASASHTRVPPPPFLLFAQRTRC